MKTPDNLDLDFLAQRDGPGLARIHVAAACSYTADGGAATVTVDCASYAELEREVNRLKEELSDALRRAQEWFAERGDVTSGSKPPPQTISDAEPDEAERGSGSARAFPQLRNDLRVEDVMTRDVKTLTASDRLSLADELMKVGRFRHVVVVTDSGAVDGVVSQRDIFHSALTWAMGLGGFARDNALEKMPVKDVMSRAETISPQAGLDEAARKMRDRKIGCLPVVDQGKKLVGILTEGDFLALLSNP